MKRAGLFDKKGDIKTSEWIECLKVKETPDIIERNLELKPGQSLELSKRTYHHHHTEPPYKPTVTTVLQHLKTTKKLPISTTVITKTQQLD